MSGLRFSGVIRDGVGRYVELHVPGRDEIPQAPADWPISLQKGSLNVQVTQDGYPLIFKQLGLPVSVTSLDQRPFPAAFEIAQHEFGNNQLRPNPNMPNRGAAQVWRATLSAGEKEYPCWVLRRYGSRVGEQLELLSGVHMRKTYNLVNGQAVLVTLQQGNAQPALPGDGPRDARSARP
jgi:hypothetical protein